MVDIIIYGGSFIMICVIMWLMFKTCSKASNNAIKEVMKGDYEPMRDLQDHEGGLK